MSDIRIGEATESIKRKKARQDANKRKQQRSTEGERYAKMLEERGRSVDRQQAKAAAERRVQTGLGVGQRGQGKRKGDFKRTVAQIEDRLTKLEKSGKYKGKYVGPDRFKGDKKKIAAWRAAGRPQ